MHIPDTPLIRALYKAHADAARNNDNASKLAAIQAYQGSGDMGKAIAAAIMTLGHLHAPIEQAWHVFGGDRFLGDDGKRTPGFGNSFHDGGDPAFWPVRNELSDGDRAWICEAEELVGLPANAAMYTAAVCHAHSLPPEAGLLIFLQARLPVWFEACMLHAPPPLWGGNP